MGRVQLTLVIGILCISATSAGRTTVKMLGDDDIDDDGYDGESSMTSTGFEGDFGEDETLGSVSTSGGFQPLDRVVFLEDGIMDLDPKGKKKNAILSRYKANDAGMIRKVVSPGVYKVCVGDVERTALGAVGLSRHGKEGTTCPGGEVELPASKLKRKTSKMKFWDDSKRDMVQRAVDVFSVGQTVRVLRAGELSTGKGKVSWERKSEGEIVRVIGRNMYSVCVGGRMKSSLSKTSCTGIGILLFPAYQLRRPGIDDDHDVESSMTSTGFEGDLGEDETSGSASTYGGFQPFDRVIFMEDGIMDLDPKGKKKNAILSRYKANDAGMIRKVVSPGVYKVCVGDVERTALGAVGLSRHGKEGTTCPGGEVELSALELKRKTANMKVWDDSKQDMVQRAVDVFSVGQTVRVLRAGSARKGKGKVSWERKSEGEIVRVMDHNMYSVCIGGMMKSSLSKTSCTGIGILLFPAYQLQRSGF